MSTSQRVLRGEVWWADLDNTDTNGSTTRGHEQAGQRPCVVVSVDRFNLGPANLVVVIPLTTRDRRIGLHVRLDPPNGNLPRISFAMTEAIRSLDRRFLGDRIGKLDVGSIEEIEMRLKSLLAL